MAKVYTNWRRRLADRMQARLGIVMFQERWGHTFPEKDFVRRLFAQLKPDCVFDVGANVGQYATELRVEGYDGIILSFEPNPEAFAELRKATEGDEHWHVFPYALGASVSKMQFKVMKHNLLSSFLDPQQDAHVGAIEGHEVARVIDVDVVTLDDQFVQLRDTYGFSNPFLKLDTQGFDLEVLKGASGVIDRFCGLVSEVSVLPIYVGAPSMAESLAAIKDLGFLSVGMFNVTARAVIQPVVEYNCYAVAGDRG
ncbi:MAG: FkbM family methyltransferase [Sphingomonadaceae bacterium]